MTARLVLGGTDAPLPVDTAGTDMAGAAERLAHVEALRPEICTLDCGSMNFAAGGDYVMVNTPPMLRAISATPLTSKPSISKMMNRLVSRKLMRSGSSRAASRITAPPAASKRPMSSFGLKISRPTPDEQRHEDRSRPIRHFADVKGGP